MKKYIVSLAIPMAILSLAIAFFVPTQKTQAQTTNCPAGYTCTPITPQPTGCPVGYTCAPINSTTPGTGPSGVGYAGISGGAQTQTCPSISTYLGIGSIGSGVVTLQNFLISNGFDIPSVSAGRTQKGYFGSQTAAALSQYQGRMGLSVTGVLDTATQTKINSGTCTQYQLPSSYNSTPPGRGGGLCPTGQTWIVNGCASQPQSQSSVRVITPNGGQTISQGQAITIQWSAQNIPSGATMNINLSNSNGVTGQIATGLNPNTSQSYSWNTGSPIGTISTISGQVPQYIYPGQYKIDLEVSWSVPVTDSNQKGMAGVTDLSDNYFTVTDSSGNLPTAPIVSSVNPTSIPNDGITTATVSGSGFNSSTAIYFSNSTYRNAYKTIPSSVSSSGQSLTFVVSQNFPPAGQYQLTTSNDGIAMSNPVNVTVAVIPTPVSTNALPVITSILPNSVTTNLLGSSNTFTISGSGFTHQWSSNYAGMGWNYRTDDLVIFQNSQGQKIVAYTIGRGQSTNDNQISFTLPTSGCDYSKMDISCAQLPLNPGTYSVFVWTPNGTSNVVNFTISSGGNPNMGGGLSCGFSVTSVTPNTRVTFPLSISGIVDNSNSSSCHWSMFEGQAGTAQLAYNYQNSGWQNIGVATAVSASDWTATKSQFSVTINFQNGYIGLPSGTPMKVIFTEENASGLPGAKTFELPLVFDH